MHAVVSLLAVTLRSLPALFRSRHHQALLSFGGVMKLPWIAAITLFVQIEEVVHPRCGPRPVGGCRDDRGRSPGPGRRLDRSRLRRFQAASARPRTRAGTCAPAGRYSM